MISFYELIQGIHWQLQNLNNLRALLFVIFNCNSGSLVLKSYGVEKASFIYFDPYISSQSCELGNDIKFFM